MSKTYLLNRVRPVHEGEWDNTKTYLELSVVYDPTTGDSYTSRKPVPAGTLLTNVEYWTKTSDFNSQLIEKGNYYNTVAEMKADNSLTAGMTAITKGYYSANDGGGAMYEIVDGIYVNSGEYQQIGTSSLYAKLLINDVIYVKQMGAKGDGVTDDTIVLQYAIDLAASKGLLLYNNKSSDVFNVSAPLYVNSNTSINLGNSAIRKTTNTVGVGSNTYPTGGGTTDTYAVDAVIIVKHANGVDASKVEIKNIKFNSSAAVKHAHAIYAPRLNQSDFKNVVCQYGKFDYALYGFLWWIVNLDYIRLDAGITTVRINNDGSGAGGSTSIKGRHIINTASTSCLDLYGVSYSVFDIPLIDHGTGWAFKFTNCNSVTLNSPAAEYLESGQFLFLSNSIVTVNSPRVYEITGHNVDTALLSVYDFSRLIMNGGYMGNYTGGTAANNFPLLTGNASYTFLNFVRMPSSNINAFRGLAGGSIVIENDSTGSTYKELVGAVETSAKFRGKRICYSNAIPASGTWSVGDIIYNSVPVAGGYIGWVCVTAGTPGTWKGFGSIEA